MEMGTLEKINQKAIFITAIIAFFALSLVHKIFPKFTRRVIFRKEKVNTIERFGEDPELPLMEGCGMSGIIASVVTDFVFKHWIVTIIQESISTAQLTGWWRL
jgi:hypothetical protein